MTGRYIRASLDGERLDQFAAVGAIASLRSMFERMQVTGTLGGRTVTLDGFSALAATHKVEV